MIEWDTLRSGPVILYEIDYYTLHGYQVLFVPQSTLKMYYPLNLIIGGKIHFNFHYPIN